MGKRVYLYAAVLLCAGILYLFSSFALDTKGVYGMGAARAVKGADAIVVLTGGKGRIEEGLLLLRGGKARTLILSGVAEDAGVDSIFLHRVGEEERKSIILDKRSRSTYENAVEVRRLMREKNLKSMVLITSAYHMKRAHFIFSRVMPPDVSIEPHSVASPNFDEKRWWASGILAVEFLKYCWYEVRLL